MVRIVHCADVHLDSPFTLSDLRKAEFRRMELRSTFTSLVAHAQNFGAKLFLISGDLFDSEYMSKETANMLYREMSRLSDCRFFIAPGNHDPYHSKSPYKALKWPENVHIFKSNDLTKIEVRELNVDVYGYAFTDTSMQFNPFSGKKPQNPDRINILVGHGELVSNGDTASAESLYCPITKSDISASEFDYIALGHIHQASGVGRQGKTYFSYPGCLEGRGFDELGYKGAMCGQIDKGVCELRGIKFSKRRYEAEEVDISDCGNENQVIAKIQAKTTAYKNDTAVRVSLTGTLRPEFVLNPADLEDYFQDFYFIQILNKTQTYIDYDSLENDKTLRGIFYSKLKEKFTSDDEDEREMAVSALKYGLKAFSGYDVID